MLLRIQKEETLRSFLERNDLLNWGNPDMEFLSRISRAKIEFKQIKEIAEAIGWVGCYGFNRLLHNHTHAPLDFIVTPSEAVSYSEGNYISSVGYSDFDRESAAFCPECVREDLASLGFSYWRRSHIKDIKVCAKHNVLLVHQCPFCQKSFGYRGHSLDVMWKGCAGNHLSGCTSKTNTDELALLKAEFVRGVFEYDFCIPYEAALSAIQEKIWSFNRGDMRSFEIIGKYSSVVIATVFPYGVYESDTIVYASGEGSILNIALDLYGDFYKFLEDVNRFDSGTRRVSELWSTYRSESEPVIQYVEEDYL